MLSQHTFDQFATRAAEIRGPQPPNMHTDRLYAMNPDDRICVGNTSAVHKYGEARKIPPRRPQSERVTNPAVTEGARMSHSHPGMMITMSAICAAMNNMFSQYKVCQLNYIRLCAKRIDRTIVENLLSVSEKAHTVALNSDSPTCLASQKHLPDAETVAQVAAERRHNSTTNIAQDPHAKGEVGADVINALLRPQKV